MVALPTGYLIRNVFFGKAGLSDSLRIQAALFVYFIILIPFEDIVNIFYAERQNFVNAAALLNFYARLATQRGGLP